MHYGCSNGQLYVQGGTVQEIVHCRMAPPDGKQVAYKLLSSAAHKWVNKQ